MLNKPLTFHSIESTQLPDEPIHLAIGMFDGLHLGHQAVIKSALNASPNGIPGVLTFSPHPSKVIAPEKATKLIMPTTLKSQFIHDLGIPVVIEHPFTPQFAQLEATAFLPYLKQYLPTLHTLYIGENFHFGHKRLGDIALLKKQGPELGIHIVSAERIQFNGEPISSSRIRTCIAQGMMAEANQLLGYTYYAIGDITPGLGLSQRIGFPNLNVFWNPELRPRFGAYAVSISQVGSTETFPGFATYEIKTTLDPEHKNSPLLQIHLFEHAKHLLPGHKLKINWHAFLRPDRRFVSVEAQKKQLERDREMAKGKVKACL